MLSFVLSSTIPLVNQGLWFILTSQLGLVYHVHAIPPYFRSLLSLLSSEFFCWNVSRMEGRQYLRLAASKFSFSRRSSLLIDLKQIIVRS